jgi:glutathione S-transferase
LFPLHDSAAILIFLAETHGWTDLYPSDPKARAKVNEYLHWHHTNARWSTPRVLVPHIHTKVGQATPEDVKFFESTGEIVDKIVGLLEQFLVKPFVAESDAPTLADYFAYCEYVQLAWLGLIDAKKYPKTAAWLARMKVRVAVCC